MYFEYKDGSSFLFLALKTLNDSLLVQLYQNLRLCIVYTACVCVLYWWLFWEQMMTEWFLFFFFLFFFFFLTCTRLSMISVTLETDEIQCHKSYTKTKSIYIIQLQHFYDYWLIYLYNIYLYNTFAFYSDSIENISVLNMVKCAYKKASSDSKEFSEVLWLVRTSLGLFSFSIKIKYF